MDVADEVGTGVGIAEIGAGGCRNDGLVELLAKITAQLGHAALGVFGELESLRTVLQCADGFARVVLEFGKQVFEFALEFTDFLPLLLLPFGREAVLLPDQLLFARADMRSLSFDLPHLFVQAIEEARDILGLRAQTLARGGDDLEIQAEALRDVDAGGRAGHTNVQLVCRLQGGFVETNGGIDHAFGIRAIDFQRRVVSRDGADAAEPAEVVGNGNGQGGAFFWIGGGTELIEQHERFGRRGARNEIDVGDVRGKGRKILLNRLIVADIGEHGIENRQLGFKRWNRNARLRHQRQQANGFKGNGLSTGVGTGYYELMG